ncbi:hypothetical protein ACQZ46_23815 [Agrobacterium salinitolerans]
MATDTDIFQDIQTFKQAFAEVKELEKKVEAYEVALTVGSLNVVVGHCGIEYESRSEIYEIYGLLSFNLKKAMNRLYEASSKLPHDTSLSMLVKELKDLNAAVAAVDVQAAQTSERLLVRDHDTGLIYDMGDITEKDRKVPGCIFTDAPWNVQIASRKPTATPSSEYTPGGAAEKMPGGGLGNFDREGGLDFSDLYPIRNPEYESGALTGNIDNFMPWHVAVDDTTFHAEITIPVKVFFCQNVSDVADEDPDISVGVAYKASGGHLYVAATYESGEFLSALDDVLVKAEKLQALPEYQTAYEHWKTRAKAYRRGVVDARRAA